MCHATESGTHGYENRASRRFSLLQKIIFYAIRGRKLVFFFLYLRKKVYPQLTQAVVASMGPLLF